MMDATKSCFLRKFLSELSCFLQNLLTRKPGPCRILVLAERFEVGTALSTLRVAQSDGMKLPDASVSLSRKAKLAPGWIVLRNDSQRGELGICAALSIEYQENDSSC